MRSEVLIGDKPNRDIALVANAIKKRWPIKAANARELVNRLLDITRKTEVTVATKDGIATVEAPADVKLVVCPNFVALASVAEVVKGSVVGLGAQDMHWEESGAFTGENAPSMLKAFGCTYSLVGHSERRTLHAETDDVVAAKYEAIQKGGEVRAKAVQVGIFRWVGHAVRTTQSAKKLRAHQLPQHGVGIGQRDECARRAARWRIGRRGDAGRPDHRQAAAEEIDRRQKQDVMAFEGQ